MITKWGVHNMFEGTKLSPDQRYAQFVNYGEQICILHYGHVFFDIAVFVDIIIAEYLLREIAQQEQSLNSKVRVLRKIATDEDKDKEAQYNEELTSLLRQYGQAEYKLYLAETMLPIGPIKQSYDTLRENTTWYLRKELVDDCVKRGGCCSRSCGCCQIRHEVTGRNKGIGHCAPTCECCSSERGFEYTAEEREGFVDDFKKKLYDNNPACVIQMAEAFFLLPLVEIPQERTQERTQCQGGKRQWWKRISKKG